MKAITIDEYANRASENELLYLVHQMIPYPGRVLLVGPPKEGKSFFGLQLGLAVAKGEPFMGRPTTASKVLYLQYDTPHKVFMQRAAHVRDNGLSYHPNLMLLDPNEPDYKKTLDIRKNPDDVRYLKEVVTTLEPRLVIIDTLRKIFSGDENSSDIGKEVFDILNDIFEHQSVVYIHHVHKLSPPPGQKIIAPIKPIDAIRGSSFYAGEVEAIYLLLGNRLVTDSRIDESSTENLEWDKSTLQWKFPDTSKLEKQELKIRELWHSRSWSSWVEFKKHILHTFVTVPSHLLNTLESQLPKQSPPPSSP